MSKRKKNPYGKYCIKVRDSLFINNNGDVFICCHHKPGLLGNIYKDSIDYIWKHSRQLPLYKLMNTYGYLNYFCQVRCTKVTDKIITAKLKEKFTAYPEKLHIMFGELCNLKCIMCGQNHGSKILLDIDVLKKNINWDKIQEVELQGGEILLMKEGKEFYLWLTKEKNKKVELSTNGMLINDEWADYMVKGSNKIKISVNAATEQTHRLVNKNSNFETVINNIIKLIKYKRKNNSTVKIIYTYTIINDNLSEVADAIEVANNLGCDTVHYNFDYNDRHLLNNNYNLINEIKNKIYNILNNEKYSIEISGQCLHILGLL